MNTVTQNLRSACLEEVRLEVLVQEDVEAQELEAVPVHAECGGALRHLALRGQQRLHQDLVSKRARVERPDVERSRKATAKPAVSTLY